MNSFSPLAWRPAEARHPVHEALRQWAARQLHSASMAMARLAGQLATPAAIPATVASRLEFHADAGAPEGALYLDGRLVGWVQGVTRL